MQLPSQTGSDARVPDRLMGYVAVRSWTRLAIADADLRPDAVAAYRSTAGDHAEVDHVLDAVGLEVVGESALGKAVTGPREAFEELTGGTVIPEERLVRDGTSRQRYVTHLDIRGRGQPGTPGFGSASTVAARIDGVLLERPRFAHDVFPSPLPPNISPKFHLRVPDDVATVLGAADAHRRGHHGDGTSVAMVDSGHYAHTFFAAHGYRIEPTVSVVPGTNPAHDPVGHGTGESANVFAVAPATALRPYRATDDDGHIVGAVSAFLRAKAGWPDVLTCSWGGDAGYPPQGQPDAWDKTWALEILDAIDQGIVVVFSAGNSQFSIEPQLPGVLSAGGVWVSPALELRATEYASGYASPWFDAVIVPTLCGAVGLPPRAQYLLLPVPPGSQLDDYHSRDLPGDPGDGTTTNDGWALFSGTSAAAPQIAGAAALVLGARRLSPAAVIDLLSSSAIDVLVGQAHPRFASRAQPGRDLATGWGLLNVSAAVARATGVS